MQNKEINNNLEIRKSYGEIVDSIFALEELTNSTFWFVQVSKDVPKPYLTELKRKINLLYETLIAQKPSDLLLEYSMIREDISRIKRGCLLKKQTLTLSKQLWALDGLTPLSLCMLHRNAKCLIQEARAIRSNDLTQRECEEKLFETKAVISHLNKVCVEIHFLRRLCCQYPVLCERKSPKSSISDLMTKECFELILDAIRGEEKVRRGLKVALRGKIQTLYKRDQQFLVNLTGEIKKAEAEIYKKIQSCHDQLQIFSSIVENEKKDLRKLFFNKVQLKDLKEKAHCIQKLSENWSVKDVSIPNIEPLEERYDQLFEALMTTIEQRLKESLRAQGFNQQKSMALLSYYQGLLQQKNTQALNQENLDSFRKKLFWRCYEKRYLNYSFWGLKSSLWLYQQKDKIHWQDILSHALGETPGFSGERTKQTLIALGWLDRECTLSQQGAWLRQHWSKGLRTYTGLNSL